MPTVFDSTGAERQLRSVSWWKRARDAYQANKANHVRFHGFLAALLPSEVDNSSGVAEVLDQLQIGACTAGGAAGCDMYQEKRQGFTPRRPARLQIYQQELDDQGDAQHADDGATITESALEGELHGFAWEDDYPYNTALLSQPIPANIKTLALQNRVTGHHPVAQDRNSIKAELAAGNVINMGFLVYPPYNGVGKDGRVPLPSGQPEGGHDNVAVGYSDSFVNLEGSVGAYKMLNDWNMSWGMPSAGFAGGFCWQPYSVVEDPNQFSDFVAWTQVSINGQVSPTPAPPTPTPAPTPPANLTVAMKVTQQPANAVVGTQAPPWTVEMLLADGTVNVADNEMDVETLVGFSNTQKVTAVSGVVVFQGDTFTAPHTGIFYRITCGSLPPVQTAPFNVTAAPSPGPSPTPPVVDKYSAVITAPDKTTHQLQEV